MSNRPLISILCLLSFLFISACTHSIRVNVNAIAKLDHSQTGKHYILTSGMLDTDSDDLYFIEFSRYFNHVLAKHNYTQVSDPAKADLEIRLSYAVSDGRSGLDVFSWPVYETIPGEVINISETSTDDQGVTKTTRRTVRIPSRIEYVGDRLQTRSYTLYNRMARLEARSSGAENSKPIWDLHLSSVGESNDIRGIMPYLATAAEPFIGKNTGRLKSVKLRPDNPLLMELQGVIQTNSAVEKTPLKK